MNCFSISYLFERIKVVQSVFVSKNNKNFNENEIKLVRRINEVVNSKTYINSNINDLLWFWANGLNKCEKIIDFGCGSGYITYLLSSMNRSVIGYEYVGKWVGQDVSIKEYKNVLDYFHNLLKKRKSLDFKYYNSLPLNIKNESVNGVVMYAVLEHLDKDILDSTLKEIKRILKKDGFLFIGKLPRKYSYQEWLARFFGLKSHKNLFTKKMIFNLFEKYGIKVQKIESIGLFFNHPNKITNFLYPITKIEKYLRFLPVVHDYRLILKNS